MKSIVRGRLSNLLVHRCGLNRKGVWKAEKRAADNHPKNRKAVDRVPETAQIEGAFGKDRSTSCEKDALRDREGQVQQENGRVDKRVESLSAGDPEEPIDCAEGGREQRRADGNAESFRNDFEVVGERKTVLSRLLSATFFRKAKQHVRLTSRANAQEMRLQVIHCDGMQAVSRTHQPGLWTMSPIW